MSAETFPAGPTPADELATIAATFPMRDRRGSVTGFYMYRRGINSGREAGPFPTIAEAEAARDASTSLDALDIVCGHVFTSRGTIVRENERMAGVSVGDVVSYSVNGLPLRGMVLTVGSTLTVAGITFEHGRMTLAAREVPADAVEIAARAGEAYAVRLAADLMLTPHATVAEGVCAAWVANRKPR